MRKALLLIGLIISIAAPVSPVYAQNVDTTQTTEAQATAAIANALPEGVTIETATPGQLNRALKRVARANPRDTNLLKAVTNVVVDTGKVSARRASTTVVRVATRSLTRTPAPTPTSTSSAPEIDVIVAVVLELATSQNLNQTQITELLTNAVDVVDASGTSDEQVNEVAQQLGVGLRDSGVANADDILKDVSDDTGVVITSKSGTTSTASLL